MPPVYVFGTSGFAKEVRDIVHDLGRSTIFVAVDERERDAWAGEEAVVLERELPVDLSADAAIGIGDNDVRQKVATRFAGKLRFPTLIHSAASFGKGQREAVARGTGNIVCAGVRMTSDIAIGDFNVLNLNATVGHDCVIDDFVNISPGATVSGNVHLRDRVWVGTGAAINQGTPEARLVIGEGTVIGSGSVVVKACEPDSVYVGIPAKKR